MIYNNLKAKEEEDIWK